MPSSGTQLAPASGSFAQLVLATLPLLCVLIYFLILAHRRPNEDPYDEEEGGEPLLEMTDVLYTFMAALVAWSSLGVYLSFYVPKRRDLIEQFDVRGYSVMGDVYFRPRSGLTGLLESIFCCGCFGRGETAILTYAHPDQDAANSDKGTTYDDEGPARRRHWAVQRRVRTYLPYSRERVQLTILPHLPRSALAKSDVEVDLAHAQRSDSGEVIRLISRAVVVPWVVFCLLGGLYVCAVMQAVEDIYDPPRWGWTVYLCTVFIITPLIAGGGNHLRWLQYKKHITDSGRVLESNRAKKIPSPEEEEMAAGDDGFMADVCGAPSDTDLGIDGGERESGTRFSRMS